MSDGVPVYWVDAFTDRPFAGNPAAVCLFDRPPPDRLLQAIAREMNLSETAYPILRAPARDGSATYTLRWFTPTLEIDLCGHATLASAWILFDELRVPATTLRFETQSGPLYARRGPGGIALDFPREDAIASQAPDALIRALGIGAPISVWQGPVSGKLLIELGSVEEVRELRPNYAALLASAPRTEVRAVIVTAPGSPPYDFVSRFFAPWSGVDEDPVTGSSHTLLAPFWGAKLGTHRMRAQQVSPRGGEMSVELLPTGRVLLEGTARVIARGRLDPGALGA
jgi:PhzF family phenazine biosynthesis protein